MGKYRKKPIEVEAFQWWPHMGEVGPVFYYPPGDVGRRPMVKTLEGCVTVSAGDWIITGVAGEHYPCRRDIFAATYEALAPDSVPEGGKP